jgi:nitroreductase
MENILQALNWRYATKTFDPTKKVSASDWKVLSESLRLAPSSYGLQPWKFMVIQNSDIRKQLKEASWSQSQVTDCSHFVVLVIKEKMDEAHIDLHLAHVAEVRGVTTESLAGFKKMLLGDLVQGGRASKIRNWAHNQSYIAMGFLMETAALMKIDACPMEGLDPAAYDRILKLEGTGWATVAAVAVGYRSATDKYATLPKVRFEEKDVFQVLE